ncbi:adhesion G protein-coupled receptor L2-like isoform X1 [Penaeus chinensis]|uniref:adhesion G protein-coupled receptor L2-like isoform X1 n=1 Tax=Penaeus chinensis TaxID=139456 RepID=UPI001FB59133|nr:adhesion G protein-coupled receptor L2-like isoform X1 [Penaeus chinensis]
MSVRGRQRSPLGRGLLVLCCVLGGSSASSFKGLDLSDAVKVGSLERVTSLLEEGAEVDARDKQGWTPLHNAAYSGNEEMVRILIKHGADINAKDYQYERTPLHIAAYNGQLAILTTLLKAKATLDNTDINERTPLHLAAWGGQKREAQSLLIAGADIDAKDKYGSTPTQLATIRHFPDLVWLLLSYCPDLRLEDNKGLTAFDYAQSIDDEELLNIYKEHNSAPCSRHRISAARMVDPMPYEGRGTNCPRGERYFPDEDLPYTWWLKETSPGVPLVITCPPGMNGTATWTCGVDGTWEKVPVLEQCRSVVIREWEQTLHDHTISAADIITSIATSLRDVTLGSGDLITIGDILGHLQEKHESDLLSMSVQSEALDLAKRYLKGSLEIVDAMLAYPGLWWGLLLENRVLTSSLLQDSLCYGAVMLATYQESSTTDFSLDSLHTRVVKQPPWYYGQEQRTFTHPLYNRTWIRLPKSFHEDHLDTRNQVKVVFVAYNELHCTINSVPCNPRIAKHKLDLPARDQVNSAVIGAKVGGVSTWHAALDEYVEVRLQHIYTGDIYLLGRPTCVWWDIRFHRWAKDGCRLVETDKFVSVCHCDHLTNLAVVMDINGLVDDTDVMYYVLQCVIIIGCVVTVVSLALCILCFLIFKDLKEKTSSLVHANLCGSLMLAELVLLGGLDAAEDTVACKTVAALLHYFFLATFTWSAIGAFHVYMTFVKVRMPERSPLKYYMCVGYLAPFSYVSLTLAFTHAEGYATRKACWLSPNGVLWTFAGPLTVIMLINAVAYFMTMQVTWRENALIANSITNSNNNITKSSSSKNNSNNSTSSRSSNNQKKKAESPMKKVCSSLAVVFILCLTWMAGFFFFISETYIMAGIFTFLNSMQGVVIFVFHIAINTPITQEVKRILK